MSGLKTSNKKVCLIVGTRPEKIKMASIIKECQLRNLDFIIINTGQHYSDNMSKIFFEELDLPQPDYNLEVGSGPHGRQTGKMLDRIEHVLLKERPDVVLTQGDTDSSFAGALAAAKIHIKVGHVESGLRSGDFSMAEELNRRMTDHISDYLFCPTTDSKQNLLKEGINPNKIFVTGNTIVDAVKTYLPIAEKKSNILTKLNLKPKGYFLMTLHRPSNVDNCNNIIHIINGLQLIYAWTRIHIVLPLHPRTEKQLDKFNLSFPDFVKIIEPVGFFDFLVLEKDAMLGLYDSAGAVEESTILGVPAITLRENTERPEAIDCGANILTGPDSDKMLRGAIKMLENHIPWKNPFGDGTAGKQIIDIIMRDNPK